MERLTYQEVPQELFNKLRAIEDYIHTSGIDSKLLDLIRIRISQINACAYCLDMHYKEIRHSGESELKLSMLSAWREVDLFTEVEKAVLSYAEALTLLSQKEIESTFSNLLKHFSKEEISFISLTITQINTWNRLMKAFGFKAGLYKVNS